MLKFTLATGLGKKEATGYNVVIYIGAPGVILGNAERNKQSLCALAKIILRSGLGQGCRT